MTPSLDSRDRSAVSSTDLLLATVVAVAILAFFPPAFAPRWTPRAALYLAVLPAAVVGIALRVRVRDRAAIAAVAFLAAASLSALLSPAPFRSLLPVLYRHESVVAWTCGLGMWALVRSRRLEGRRRIEWAFVGAVLASVVVGVLQLVANVDSGPLAMIGNRASGLSLNPVYLGALAAGTVAWTLRAQLVDGASARGTVLWASMGFAMLGVWISGSRIALLAVVVAVLAAFRIGPRPVVTRAAVILAMGAATGELVRWLNRAVSGGSSLSATGRLDGAQVASGFGVRFEVWRFDLSAIARRPILGHGPGSHANAIQPHLSADFVERTKPDELLNNWTDAHNVVLELLVSVGVVGLVLAVGFVALQAGAVRGPSAWAVAAISLTWLLQPISYVTLIPTLALLGAAGAPPPNSAPISPGRPVRVAVVALGVACAGWLVGADRLLQRAENDRTIANGELVSSWWWHDPMSSREGAVLGLREAVLSGEASDRDAVLAMARSMTDRDPTLAFWWVQRGDIEQVFGLDDEARRSYERALERLPESDAARRGLIRLPDPESVSRD